MKKSQILLLLLNVLFGSVLFAQTDANITGHVVDQETHEHIPYASISMDDTNIATACDRTGHYFLKNLKPGLYTITATVVGYNEESIVVHIEANKTKEINFNLNKSKEELDEVVVTATRTTSKKREAPVIVGIIDKKLFEITNSCNLAQGLNFQPGLRVENNCQNCGFQQVRINGLEGPYSQVLIDSRPIFSALSGVYGIEQIPASMIDRVEVVRGGGSALFGSNAIGGTINVITKEPLYNSFSFSNTYSLIDAKSSDNIVNLNGSIVSDNHKAGIYIFGMIRDREIWDANGDNFSEVPKLRSETFGFRSYLRPSSFSKISLEYHRIHEFRRGGDSLQRPPHEANIAEMVEHSINGGGIQYQLFSRNYKRALNVYSSVQNTSRNSYYGVNKDPYAYGNTTGLTLATGVQYSQKIDRVIFMPAEITAGIEYNYDKIKDEMLGYNRLLDQTTNITGLYFQNEWKNTKFTFLSGIRIDNHNLIDNIIVSPRLNIRYSPFRQLNLRTSYAAGYRAPQTFDEDLHVQAVNGESVLIRNSKDLTQERSHSVNLSADWNLSFGSAIFNLVADGFYTNLKDVFILEEIGEQKEGYVVQERRNGSGAVVKGINIETKFIPARFIEIQAGFTLQQSTYKNEEKWTKEQEVTRIKKMLRTPEKYGYVTTNLIVNKRFNFSISGIYTGKMDIAHYTNYKIVHTPQFFDAAIKVNYAIKINSTIDLQLNGGIQNIFNDFQSDFDKGKDRDSGYIYGPGIPRTFFIGIKIGIF